MDTVGMKSSSSKIYHIPAGRSYADDLVKGVRGMVTSPEDLADATILVPNRRLAHSLRTAFLRDAGGKAELLPSMMPIGLVEEDAPELAEAGWDAEDLPPMVPALERQLMLAEQLAKTTRNMTEALGLAGALADFLDEAQANNCDMSKLDSLVEEGDLAIHWRKLLAYLKVLVEWWPLQLEKRLGRSDPVEWRNAAIMARAEVWRSRPPKGLVVVAASPGGLDLALDLMRVVMELDRGAVVLPGLDVGMAEEEWEGLLGEDETAICHPQFQLAKLLKALEVDRSKVELWPGTEDGGGNPRLDLLREMFRPAGQSDEWRTIPDRETVKAAGLERKAPGGGAEWLKMVECYDRREEAEVIAIAMREALETPGRTAVLATADRVLGRMVIGELSRWGIELEDSAGILLAETPPAHFLRLILEAWVSGFAPRPLMAMLQHQLAASGSDRAGFRENVRRLDKRLRGPRPAGGLAGLAKHLKSQDKSESLVKFVEKAVAAPMKPLEALKPDAPRSLAECLEALSTCAEAMGALPDEPLAVWQGQAGTRVARFLVQAKKAAEAIGTRIEPSELPAVLSAMMQRETIYPDRISHPRLSVLGQVEARMHSADLVILGGMNEGTSPPQPKRDPWMSNGMRVDFGLPPVNWRVGLAAHDTYMEMARAQVLITRAQRQEGAPTEPSRWVRRLTTILRIAKVDLPEASEYLRLAAARNRVEGEMVRLPPPAPTLDSKARPRNFSATEMDTLLKDPYAIYARKVLKLRALDPLDQAPGAAERGSFVHDVLRAFTERFPKPPLPEDALDQLLDLGRREFGKLPENPWADALWWPQFEAVARWFIDNEHRRAGEMRESHAEIRGEMEIDGLTGPYTLSARADRIDMLDDGRIRIIDYKTGGIPTLSAVQGGRALQLVVEAVLATGGHFPGIEGGGEVAGLEYWKLTGRGEAPGEIHLRNLEPEALETAGEDLAGLLRQFDDDEAAYVPEPDAREANRFSDYKHLARLAEWKISHGEGGE